MVYDLFVVRSSNLLLNMSSESESEEWWFDTRALLREFTLEQHIRCNDGQMVRNMSDKCSLVTVDPSIWVARPCKNAASIEEVETSGSRLDAWTRSPCRGLQCSGLSETKPRPKGPGRAGVDPTHEGESLALFRCRPFCQVRAPRVEQ